MSTGTGLPVTMVGRDRDVDLLHETFRDGTGAALLVVGEAGMGKTALLRRAQDEARAAGQLVVSTSAGEFQTVPSLEGLAALLRPLQPHLHALTALHREAIEFALGANKVPAPSELAVSTATLALLRAAARRTPLLVTVDDAQWWDPASVGVLGFVARRLAETRVTLLVTTRPGHSTAIEHAGLLRHELGPLDDAAARQLLRHHHPELTRRECDAFVRAAAGNPLCLLELPRTSRVPNGHSFPNSPWRGLPEAVTGLFGPRISALPAPTRDVMLVAALEGTGDLAVVTRAAGRTAPDLLVFAELNGLLTVDEVAGTLHFRHPLVPATVVALAGDAQRRAAHGRLAVALPHSSLRRTWHLSESAAEPDEETAALIEEQAHLARRRGDTTTAAALLRRAAVLSPERARRAQRQVRAAFIGADMTGDLTGARDLLDDADRLSPELTRSLPATLAATFLLLNGECDVDTAHRLLSDAIRTHPGRHDPDDPYLDDALHSLLMMCWFGGRRALWRSFEEGTSRLGDHVPPLLQLCQHTFGDPVHHGLEALPALEEQLRRLPFEQDPLQVTRVALACVYTDRLAACRGPLRTVIEDGREGGAVALAIHALVSSCVDAWLTGQWDDAVAMATEGMELCRTHGYRRYSVILGGYVEQLVRIARGSLDDGRDAAEEMAQWATDRGAGMCEVFAEHLLTLRAIALGDHESAFEHVTRISAPGDLGEYNPHALWVLLDLVESAVATGRHGEARAHVAAMRRRRIDRLSPRLQMLVQGCTALVATPDDARTAFEAALDVPSGGRWPFDHARIELAFGDHLRRRRDLSDARLHLGRAAEEFHRLGARPWQRRAEAALRAAGGDRTASADAPPAATGEPLTPREAQVAELAAQGLSNKEIGARLFLSPRSVGATLYRLFPKLGITSRAAVATALERRSGQDSQVG